MKRLEKQIIVTFIILCLSCMNVFGNDVFNSSRIISKKGNGNFNAFTSLSVEKEEKTPLSSDKSFFKKRKDILYTCNIDVDGNINGVHISGTITIEGISFFECLAIKVRDIFDSSY